MAHDPGASACAHIPVRTCLGCRSRAAKHELLRVVARGQDGVVVPDPGSRAPGRGGYLHPTPACFDLAIRRRAFGRALRVPGKPDTTPVRDHLQQENDRDLPPGGHGGPHGPARP